MNFFESYFLKAWHVSSQYTILLFQVFFIGFLHFIAFLVKKCSNIKLEKSPFFPTKKGEQTLPQNKNKNRSTFIAFCVCAQEKL